MAKTKKTTGTPNTEGLTIDLTKHPGCYTYYLAANQKMLEAMSQDETTTVNEYKTIVFNMILDAYFNAKAKKEFIASFVYLQYKSQIYKRIDNAIRAAYIFEPKTMEEIDEYNKLIDSLEQTAA